MNYYNLTSSVFSDESFTGFRNMYRLTTRITGIAISLCTVVLICTIDYLTGSELSFSIFYLIPISITTILLGCKAGYLTAFLSALCWLVADLAANHAYSNDLIPYWNTAVRLGYFIAHTVLLSAIISSRDKMRNMAFHDPLTGASNWRFFEETVRRSLSEMRRSRKPITLSYIDLDNFKQVNDTFGHETGDEVLKTVVESIQNSIRPSDLLARMGGDEFALLLPDTNSENSRPVLSRIAENFNSLMTAQKYPVTMSIGAVSFNTPPISVEAMVQQADELMYAVKKAGKNNIKYSEWPPVISRLS